MNNYFTFKELIKSKTADKLGIDNTPPDDVMDNLLLLIEELDRIRDEFGSPIYVNSGYRCKELNKAVGGVPNSAHLKGLAADITSKDNKKLFQLIKEKGNFDKLIDENNLSWIHFQINPEKNQKKILKISTKNG